MVRYTLIRAAWRKLADQIPIPHTHVLDQFVRPASRTEQIIANGLLEEIPNIDLILNQRDPVETRDPQVWQCTQEIFPRKSGNLTFQRSETQVAEQDGAIDHLLPVEKHRYAVEVMANPINLTDPLDAAFVTGDQNPVTDVDGLK